MLDGVQHAASRSLAYAPEPAASGADDSGVRALCYRSRKGTTALGGALAPSRDQAGRRFPIAAVSELALDAELGQHPEALPLVLESVWATTSQLVLELQAFEKADLEAAALDATTLHADVDVD